VSGGTSEKGGVDVYNCNSLEHTRNIVIPDSKGLRSIVAWPRNKFSLHEDQAGWPQSNSLYISDEIQREIYRYDLLQNETTHWSLGKRCFGLSVTRTGNILVVLGDVNKINEYSPDGSLIHEIQLPSGFVCPQHCIQLSNDQFLVSHIGEEHLVCIVNAKGDMVKFYDRPSGSEFGQLNKPRHMAVDEHDNILVVDENNRRVDMLDCDLNHLGCVPAGLPGDQLRGPRAVFCDKRLYIGDINRILVTWPKYI